MTIDTEGVVQRLLLFVEERENWFSRRQQDLLERNAELLARCRAAEARVLELLEILEVRRSPPKFPLADLRISDE